MGKLISVITVSVFAMLGAGAAHAGEGYGSKIFTTDSGSMRVSGRKCETFRESDMQDTIMFNYNYGQRSGEWGSDLVTGDYTTAAGIFVAGGKGKRHHRMDGNGQVFSGCFNDLQSYGDTYCGDDFDGLSEDGTWVNTLSTTFNKRGDQATFRARISSDWVENTVRERENTINFRYTGKYDMAF